MKNINYTKLKKAELVDIIQAYEGEVEAYENQLGMLHKELLEQDKFQDMERDGLAADKLDLFDRLDSAKAWRNIFIALFVITFAGLVLVLM